MFIQISDFGLARDANMPSGDSSSGRFPIKWTAPEALRNSVSTVEVTVSRESERMNHTDCRSSRRRVTCGRTVFSYGRSSRLAEYRILA